jgi:hypothetical protein
MRLRMDFPLIAWYYGVSPVLTGLVKPFVDEGKGLLLRGYGLKKSFS